MNLLPARIDGIASRVARTEIALGRALGARRGAVTLGVRPGALRLGRRACRRASIWSRISATAAIVNLQVEDVLVKLRTDKPPRLAEGESVHLSFDPEDAHLFNEKTGLRL